MLYHKPGPNRCTYIEAERNMTKPGAKPSETRRNRIKFGCAYVRTCKITMLMVRLKTLVDGLWPGPRLVGRLGSEVRASASFSILHTHATPGKSLAWRAVRKLMA